MKIINGTLLTAALLVGGFATNSLAQINAYSFDKTTKDAPLYQEFKQGDFNPYWFQENEVKADKAQTTQYEYYAYASSKDTPKYQEFKKGDFNPYWFELN